MASEILSSEEHLRWDHNIQRMMAEFGGAFNGHTHLCRARTNDPGYWAHMGNFDPEEAAEFSLEVKQDFVGNLHAGLAYQPDDLLQRMETELERMIQMGTRGVVSFIDATPDIGLVAIRAAAELRKKFRGRIDFQTAVSPIFGFKEDPKERPFRWEVYQEAAEIADILGALPSRDERAGGIGFVEHVRRVIELGIKLGKPVHLQVDQRNLPTEHETEMLIEAVRWLGSPEVKGLPETEPTVWAVHVISPSAWYDEERFQRLIEGLLKYNIGVICCPSAALSMLQLTPVLAPTHNSIARLLEMATAGVRIMIGTDNIDDIFIPNGDGNVRSELWLANTVFRFYRELVWAKIGAGIPLNNVDKEYINRALQQAKEEREAVEKDPEYQHYLRGLIRYLQQNLDPSI